LKRLDMINRLFRAGISEDMYWLGSIEKANGVNGLTYNGSKWIVYFREHGIVSNINEYSTQEEACDGLFNRLIAAGKKNS